MRDLRKKKKQIRHCNIIPSDLSKWVFLEQTEMVFGETHFILVAFLTISHPIVYHKYILLPKSIQMQNDIPFSNFDWNIVLRLTCN